MKDLYKMEKVAIRMIKEPPLYTTEPIDSVEKAAEFIAGILQGLDRETFGLINLRSDGVVINFSIISVGVLNASLVHPREVMKTAVLSSADSIVLFHNHPSTSVEPSEPDIQITKRLIEAGVLMGIHVQDHIIVGNEKQYYSFREQGMIEIPELPVAESIEDLDFTEAMVAENKIRIYSDREVREIERQEHERELSALQEQVNVMTDPATPDGKDKPGSGKPYDWKAAREKRDAEIKDITERLETGIRNLFESESYKAYLSCLAKFPKYSLNNSLLIYLQKPDAQLCNSYTGWKKLGRHVKKGEHGIRIFAPAPYKVQVEQEKKNPKTGRPYLDAQGNPVMETVTIERPAYKVVSTFSLDQTEGKEIPRPGVTELTGDVKGYEILLEAIVQTCPVPVTFEEIISGAKGYYSPSENRIVIQSGMGELQTIKTLTHEMAHSLAHSPDAPKEQKATAGPREVTAESCAFTCLSHWGLDCSDYSFMYISGWSAGKELPELRESLQLIRDTSCSIITEVDAKVEQLVKAKEISNGELSAGSMPDRTLPQEPEAAPQLCR